MLTYLLRALAFLFGLAVLLGVTWLGYQTAIDPSPKLVAGFGVASAIAAPLGLSLLTYAFRSADVVTKLSKVPEIEKLVAAAQTQEEKIKLLEKQREQLADAVRVEARRQSLLEQRSALEKIAIRTLEDLKAADSELALLDEKIAQDTEIVKELEAVRERLSARRRGDPVFMLNKHQFILSRTFFEGLPWGMLLYEVFKLAARALAYLQKPLPKPSRPTITRSSTSQAHESATSAQLHVKARISDQVPAEQPATAAKLEERLAEEEQLAIEEAAAAATSVSEPEVRNAAPQPSRTKSKSNKRRR